MPARLSAVFFLTILTAITAMAQNHAMDSLKKYSYYVFGKQPTADGESMQTVEGTCFFIKTDSTVFLVSAKHLMTSWSTADAEKLSLYPDTLFIRFPSAGNSSFFDFAIDIRPLKAAAEGSYYYNEPDIFVMPFPDAAKFSVNMLSVTELEPIPAGVNAASVVYGFPKTDPFLLEGRLYSSPAENISYRDNKKNAAISDKINYLIKCDGMVQGGYSGAPVFLKNDDAAAWYFGGIVSQGVPGDNYFFVVKPAFLLEQVNHR